MNGGRYTSRGIYLQALISVFESVRTTSWKNIVVEPDGDKIDIEITFIDNSIKVIQVKSTKNNFKPSEIKTIISSLVNANTAASEYEAVFIGEFSPTAKEKFWGSDIHDFVDNTTNSQAKIKITPMSLDLENIDIKVKKELNEYLSKLGLEVNKEKLSIINSNLIVDTLLASTQGKTLLVEQFNDRLRRLVEILYEQDEKQANEIVITPESRKLYKKWKLIRLTTLLVTIMFLFSPILKYYSDGLNIFDKLGLGVFWAIVFGIFSLFKISDKKFKKIEQDEIQEYSRNSNKAQNKFLKVMIIDKVEFTSGNRRVYREIILHNLYQKKIDYIQGDIYFYNGSTRMYIQDFSIYNINPNNTINIYDDYLVKQKSKKYWTKFSLEVTKSSNIELVNNKLDSTSEFRTYGTLLNSYYMPVIRELLLYESSWARDVINNYVNKIMFYSKERTFKRLLFVIINVLILIFSVFFASIGIYNSLYLMVELFSSLFLK